MKTTTIIDEEMQGDGETQVEVIVRYKKRAHRSLADAVLLITADETNPATVGFMGDLELIDEAVAAAIIAGLEHKRLTAALHMVLGVRSEEVLKCFFAAVNFTIKEAQHGRAESGTGPDAGGEAEPGAGGPGATDDPEGPPQEGGG